MALLDDVLEANGGVARWNNLKQFTLHLSVGGRLFSPLGSVSDFKDLTTIGSTRTQSIRFTGLMAGERCGSFQPDSVTIERLDGHVLRTWNNPSLLRPDHAKSPLTDELHLVFLCGFSIWNYLTTPFLLSRPGVRVEELPPWRENDQSWRRLGATFPPDIVSHSTEQIFYFDARGLQRRTDHDLLGTPVAHYSWAHQAFCGIMVPTLRRSSILRPDGTVISRPALVEVEIFDAAFE
jgi:hypothetical protein